MATGTMAVVIIMTAFNVVAVYSRGPPRIVSDNYQRRHLANVGDTLRLACPVDASGGGSSASGPAVAAAAAAAGGLLAPPALVTWLKDGEEINVGWERYKTVKHDTLVVRDVEMEDTGIFVCRATNGFGSVDVQHLVYVVAPGNNSVTPPSNFDEDYLLSLGGRGEPPAFVNTIDNLYVVVPLGGTTRLSCHASGRPKPDIRWFKNDMVMEQPDAGVGSPALPLDDVTTQHGGRYKCQVSNRFGSISRTFVVDVSGNNSPDGGPVFISPESDNVTVVTGETASLVCRFYSDLPTKVQWARPSNDAGDIGLPLRSVDTVTSPADGGERYYVAKLTVHMTTPGDSGEYQCTAVNERGVAHRSVYLYVRLAPSDHISSVSRTTAGGGLFGDNNGQLSVITPISAVCIVLVVIIVISAIAFVVCRRRGRCRSPSEKSPAPACSTHPHPNAHHLAPQPHIQLQQQQQHPASTACTTTYLASTIGRDQAPPADEYHRLQWQPMQQQPQQQCHRPPPPPSGSTAAWCKQQQQWQRPMFPMSPSSNQSSPLPHQPLLQQQQQPLPVPGQSQPPMPKDSIVEYRYYEEC